MADAPTRTPKNARTAQLRAFFNLGLATPDTGALAQTDLAAISKAGGKGLTYGHDNTVPVLAMEAKQQSGTAYRCLERRAQILEGSGFVRPERDPQTGQLRDASLADTVGDTPVPGHVGKTANDLWAQLCSYAGDLNGAAVLVRYKGRAGGFAIGEVHVLPFASVRKTANGTYLLNHRFGRRKFKAADTTEHLPFNPDRAQVRKEMEAAQKLAVEQKKPYVQAGQILYIYNPKSGEEDYPLPPHWAGLESVLADAAYMRYDLEEVEGGFSAKGLLAMIGAANDTQPDENNQTEVDRDDEELSLFTNAGAREAGVRRKSVLVVNAATKDTAPVWVPMGTTVDLRWLSEKKQAIGEEVCRHIGIPPILVGFAKAGQLGAVQEILNAAQLTQDSLESLRMTLLRAFWRLMPSLNGVVPGRRNYVEMVQSSTPTPAP